jgi:hypothetical protein
MSDARLRARERAASTGDVHDQARLLLERVRSGRLSRERLELAAWAGEPAACAATNGAPAYDLTLGDWCRGFERWNTDKRLGVRVAAAACRETWDRLEPGHGYHRGRRLHDRYRSGTNRDECLTCDGLVAPQLAIAAVDGFLACPCDFHRGACTWAGQALGEQLRWWGMLVCSATHSASDKPPSGAHTADLCAHTLNPENPGEAGRALRLATGLRLARWALDGEA